MDKDQMREFASAVLDGGVKFKQTLLAERKPEDDEAMGNVPPQIGYLIDGDEEFLPIPDVAIQAAILTSGGSFAIAVGALIKAIRHHVHPDKHLKGVFCLNEAYTCETEKAYDEIIERYGSLEQSSKWDPASPVEEALVVAFAFDDLVGGYDVVAASRRFRIDDGGRAVFADKDDYDHFGSGRLMSAIKLALESDHE